MTAALRGVRDDREDFSLWWTRSMCAQASSGYSAQRQATHASFAAWLTSFANRSQRGWFARPRTLASPGSSRAHNGSIPYAQMLSKCNAQVARCVKFAIWLHDVSDVPKFHKSACGVNDAATAIGVDCKDILPKLTKVSFCTYIQAR